MPEKSSGKLPTDRSRPIEENHLKIADTFQDAGTRPIEESPEFLITEKFQVEDLENKD